MSHSRNTHGQYEKLQDDHRSSSEPKSSLESLLQEGLRNFEVDTTLSGAANLLEQLRWSHQSGLLRTDQLRSAVAVAIYSMLQNQHSRTPSETQLYGVAELATFFEADRERMVEAAKLLEKLQPTFDQHVRVLLPSSRAGFLPFFVLTPFFSQSFGVQSMETHKMAYFWILYRRQKSAEVLRQEIMASFHLKGNMSDYELSQVGQEHFVILDSFTPTLGGGVYLLRRRDKSLAFLIAAGVALLAGVVLAASVSTASTQPKKRHSKQSDDET